MVSQKHKVFISYHHDHKVFISYHHDADQAYADKLRELYGGNAIIDKSMYADLSCEGSTHRVHFFKCSLGSTHRVQL
jgi:hypothetical protein